MGCTRAVRECPPRAARAPRRAASGALATGHGPLPATEAGCLAVHGHG
ncbi:MULTISPECIES: hypothetical protein [unclassified Streptomyces]|nr:hypothetical protein [Streptomyces sp. NBC_01429]